MTATLKFRILGYHIATVDIDLALTGPIINAALQLDKRPMFGNKLIKRYFTGGW